MVTSVKEDVRSAADINGSVTGEREPFNNFPEARKDRGLKAHEHRLFAKGYDLLQEIFPYIEQALIRQATSPGPFGGRFRRY